MKVTIFGINYREVFEVDSLQDGVKKLKELKKELNIDLDMFEGDTIQTGFSYNSNNGKIERIKIELKPTDTQKLVNGNLVAKTDKDYIEEGKIKLERYQKLNKDGYIEHKTIDELKKEGLYSIEQTIKDKKDAIAIEYTSYIDKGVVYKGKVYQCDDNSVRNMEESISLGLPASWKLKDNSFIELTLAELIEIHKLALTYRTTLKKVVFKLKSDIENLQTVTKIDEYNIEKRFANEFKKY